MIVGTRMKVIFVRCAERVGPLDIKLNCVSVALVIAVLSAKRRQEHSRNISARQHFRAVTLEDGN